MMETDIWGQLALEATESICGYAAYDYDTRLWRNVSLRPEKSGLHVGSLESLLALISVRFGPSLRYIELPIELITHTVLHELAAKCSNLTYMLFDFSTDEDSEKTVPYEGFREKDIIDTTIWNKFHWNLTNFSAPTVNVECFQHNQVMKSVKKDGIKLN